MAQGKRFKFAGSSIAVLTGYGTPVAISAATKTDPTVLTATGHGLLDGAVGKVDGIVGMTALNGGLYVFEAPSADTLELIGVNSTNYAAYVSGGTVAPGTFTEFCEATSITQQDGTADRIEVTSVCSTAKEYEVGLSDSGTLSMDFNDAPLEMHQAFMRGAKTRGELIAVKVVYPNDGGTRVMFGTVSGMSWQAGANGTYKGSATLQLTGESYVLVTV